MRILILNWRCPRHPKAGGAEILTHELARRMVAAGDQVEWFCGSFPGALPEEYVDGVRIVRRGRQWTVHWNAFRRYRGRLRGRFDVVIDEVNTMPFFTPLWAGIPTLALIFQLAREVWWYETRFPVSLLGFLAERIYLMAYRNTDAVTISRSTESDLRDLGFRGEITIAPIGIEPGLATDASKSSIPTFLYVGRLAPSKRVDHVVRAFAIFRNTAGNGILRIVGTGPPHYTASLGRLVDRLALRKWVTFEGNVSNREKHRLMSEAQALVLASVREGWGLVVTEANSHGTPAVVYNVRGLRDSVRHGQTGILVRPSPKALAEGMARLCANANEYESLANEARIWSRGFSYDLTADAFRRAIAKVFTGGAEHMVTWSR